MKIGMFYNVDEFKKWTDKIDDCGSVESPICPLTHECNIVLAYLNVCGYTIPFTCKDIYLAKEQMEV